MSGQGVWSECLSFHPPKPVVVENSGGALSQGQRALWVILEE